MLSSTPVVVKHAVSVGAGDGAGVGSGAGTGGSGGWISSRTLAVASSTTASTNSDVMWAVASSSSPFSPLSYKSSNSSHQNSMKLSKDWSVFLVQAAWILLMLFCL